MNWSYIKAFVWASLIFIGSSISGESLNGVKLINIPGFDKLIHFTWYFVLCLLLLTAVSKQRGKLTLGQIILISFICFSYGGILEILQGTVFTKRSQDIFDFIANCSGAIVATVAFGWFFKRKFWRKVL